LLDQVQIILIRSRATQNTAECIGAEIVDRQCGKRGGAAL
jgi:hypothetical protein